jgi:hypothetical protein
VWFLLLVTVKYTNLMCFSYGFWFVPSHLASGKIHYLKLPFSPLIENSPY